VKEIPLTQGKFALVDDADFRWLSRWKWYAVRHFSAHHVRCHARRNRWHEGRNDPVYMHREILGEPLGKLCISVSVRV
jgi:hypothetical protein